MKTLELLHALMVREGDQNLDYERGLINNMVHLCGPFIEEQAGTIIFVHFSAKELVDENTYTTYRLETSC
jgi:hypothetical protein